MYDHERGLCLPEPQAPAPEPLCPERDAQDVYGNAALQEQLRARHSGGAPSEGHHDPSHAVATAAVLGETVAAVYEAAELTQAGHAWPHASTLGPRLGAAAREAGAESSPLGAVTRGGGAVVGPLAVCAGGMELAAAQDSFERGDDAEGVRQTVAGGLSTAGGVATTATALLGAEAVGVGVASTGPVCAAAGLGLLAGHTADQASDASGLVTRPRPVRGLGSEPDTERESLGMSEWLTEQMAQVREETGSDALAVGAGIVMLAHLPTLWALDGVEHRPLQPRTDAAVCE